MKRVFVSMILGTVALTAQAAPPTVAELLKAMTLEDKVGQMTQPARDYLVPGDITKYRLGSVLSGGGSVPASNTVEGWRAMVGAYQAEALATPLRIPLLYGIDAVHGHNNLLNATMFPHNIGLGAAADPDLVFRISRATADELKETGIPWTFAPCIAVVQDLRWGRTYEGYSRDPELTSRLAVAAVRGLQGDRLGDTGVAATIKHFVGDGGTKGGIDQGDTLATREDLEKKFLPPYRAALALRPATVMASFSSINGLKMHAHRDLLTGWLKEDQGFEGFVVSDWAALKQLPGSEEDQVAAAINAGIDMVMVPDTYVSFLRALTKVVVEGRVSRARVDEAVSRILEVKRKLGLWERPLPQAPANRAAHQAIAREAVQKSFTLLKNSGVLPLPNRTKILVIGPKADDMGVLCGGWTLTWQGETGPITAGETLLAGLVRRFGADNVRSSVAGVIPEGFKPDVAVLVIGEGPYAEMKGDSQTLAPEASDLRRFQRWTDSPAGASVPLVTLVVSGRPLVMNPILDRSNAVAALWLPGSEAGSVAEVLAGDVRPTGRLPQPWPRDPAQTSEVWPLGFGLGY